MKHSTPEAVDRAIRNLELRVNALYAAEDTTIIPVGKVNAYRVRTTAGTNYIRVSTEVGNEAIELGNSVTFPDIDLLGLAGGARLLLDGVAGGFGQTITTDTNGVPSWGSLSGTPFNSWTINNDATNAIDESASLVLLSSNEAANDDVIRHSLIAPGTSETLYLQTERNRNAGGYATVASTFGIGVPSSTADLDAGIQLNSGDGTNAITATLRLIPVTVSATLRRYFALDDRESGTTAVFDASGHATNTLALGRSCVVLANNSIGIGPLVSIPSTADDVVVIGYNASVGASVGDAVVIGWGAGSTGDLNTVVGFSANAGTGTENVLIGAQTTSTTSSNLNVIIGNGAGTSGNSRLRNVIIGPDTVVPGSDNIVIGYSIDAADFTSGVVRHIVLGGEGSTGDWRVYLGHIVSTTPGAVTISPANASGSNVAGSNLVLVGGASTGTGAGGNVLIQSTPAGSAGSTLNAATTVIEVGSGARLGFYGVTPVTRPSGAAWATVADVYNTLVTTGLVS